MTVDTVGCGDAIIFSFFEPNTNSFDFVSLALSSSVGLLLIPNDTVFVVIGLTCDVAVNVPNLNPDAVGAETILSDAGKSFAFDATVLTFAPNENVGTKRD